jgi:predicted metal-dependent phosphoesterase TrpH
MIIDMHVHTQKSGDASATVAQYCRAIQRYREHYPFHGFVITEHSQYDHKMTGRKIGDNNDVLILQGVEVDTNLGHLLLYGMTDSFLKQIDISQRHLDSHEVIQTINDCGGIAVPAHPFRNSIYGQTLIENGFAKGEINIIEELNGSNSQEENKKATALMKETGLKGIGGSDAHYVNRIWFLNCATEFKHAIQTMEDLVKELREGYFRAVPLDSSVLGEF